MSGCYFCDENGITESHHIVPRRFGGSDSEENLVDVCPTCHSKLESLYNKRFYQEISLFTPPDERYEQGVIDATISVRSLDYTETGRKRKRLEFFDHKHRAVEKVIDECLGGEYRRCKACSHTTKSDPCHMCESPNHD